MGVEVAVVEEEADRSEQGVEEHAQAEVGACTANVGHLTRCWCWCWRLH